MSVCHVLFVKYEENYVASRMFNVTVIRSRTLP